MQYKAKTGDHVGSGLITRPGILHRAKARGLWSVVCFDAEGREKWTDQFENIITNVGLDHLLDVTLSAAAANATWYVGLADSTPTPAAGDTMVTHAGWTEITAYSETLRQTWTEAGVSSQSITNSASKATFSINGSATTGGAFLVSNSTKGGTTGILYAIGVFAEGDRVVVNGDTVQVTATFTMADDGV